METFGKYQQGGVLTRQAFDLCCLELRGRKVRDSALEFPMTLTAFQKAMQEIPDGDETLIAKVRR